MKIMVGFDGSKVSEAAVELAAKRAQVFGAQILLVHSMVGGPDVPKRDFENSQRELEYHKNEFKKKDIVCESLLSVRGLQPGEDLVQLAEEQQVDEIIMGVRRRSKVGKLVFGSTAQYVILNAPCPVVTVK
ncbi:MAG: universal stress protein [Deltaproteobacteria bacterium]|jgi:nucleotide-binding universal stress UspA family protein|nr:universal stress protein [Deltaproteobacteria bacterium]MBW2516187.1 universal stress protein [Deltaproteobacteria bacterium]